MAPAVSKQESSGAPVILSCLSSDLSSGRSGTPSMLTPDKPVLWMGIISACVCRLYPRSITVCVIDTHDDSRLVRRRTLVPQGKYFTMTHMTVSVMALSILDNPQYPCSHPGVPELFLTSVNVVSPSTRSYRFDVIARPL